MFNVQPVSADFITIGQVLQRKLCDVYVLQQDPLRVHERITGFVEKPNDASNSKPVLPRGSSSRK